MGRIHTEDAGHRQRPTLLSAAWCRGWIDGHSYTDLRLGNESNRNTLDQAAHERRIRIGKGLWPPGTRGPLRID
jgi:hypothetical protein